jgi:hypothetical protein
LHEKTSADFELLVLIPLDKYESFNDVSKKRIDGIKHSNFTKEDVLVKDPNNPAKLIPCRLIKFLKYL